jgi:hypothetical protein
MTDRHDGMRPAGLGPGRFAQTANQHAARREHEPTADAVRFSADQDAPPAGPGGTPKVTIALTVEITGEWVTPEVIADTAHQLGASLCARLAEVSAETARDKM